MTTPELRQKWRNYFDECDRIQKKYENWYNKECARITAEWHKNRMFNPTLKLPVYPPPWTSTPPFPEELRGLT
jgi:hypothetical protein